MSKEELEQLGYRFNTSAFGFSVEFHHVIIASNGVGKETTKKLKPDVKRYRKEALGAATSHHQNQQGG